jgi:hypothetical protein
MFELGKVLCWAEGFSWSLDQDSVVSGSEALKNINFFSYRLCPFSPFYNRLFLNFYST